VLHGLRAPLGMASTSATASLKLPRVRVVTACFFLVSPAAFSRAALMRRLAGSPFAGALSGRGTPEPMPQMAGLPIYPYRGVGRGR
jgi:hypothetical protein